MTKDKVKQDIHNFFSKNLGNYIPFYTKIKKNQVKGGFLRLPSIPQIF